MVENALYVLWVHLAWYLQCCLPSQAALAHSLAPGGRAAAPAARKLRGTSWPPPPPPPLRLVVGLTCAEVV